MTPSLAILAVFAPLLAVVSLWYAVPLIVSVSLVCAATRQEQMLPDRDGRSGARHVVSD